MSQWGNEHPEQMAEIAALPPNEQNAALRDAIGYDPDAIRDRYEEEQRIHCHRDLSSPGSGRVPSETPAGASRPSSGTAPAGIPSRRRTGMDCPNCGAHEDQRCQPWCLAEQYS